MSFCKSVKCRFLLPADKRHLDNKGKFFCVMPSLCPYKPANAHHDEEDSE